MTACNGTGQFGSGTRAWNVPRAATVWNEGQIFLVLFSTSSMYVSKYLM